MHVGLNALHLVPRETGGSELYVRRLIPALLEARPDIRLTVFVSREGSELRQAAWASEVDLTVLPVRARSRVRRVLAEQTLLPPRARQLDLLHNLFTTAPALPTVPQVTTILDLIYKRVPDTHEGVLTRGMDVLTRVSARRSRRIIAISEATKRDVVEFLGVDPDTIDVTYLGPGLAEVPPEPESELRRRLGLGDSQLVLSVSAKRAHKNLERLIDAVAALRARHDLVLVIPGYATALEERLKQKAGAGVRFTGWLDDEALDGLYRAATCFAFPSLAEGFGLPVLEALTRGAPVACSDATSLPEVAGDAALYFDPYDTGAIAEAIERLLGDAALRERLRERGYAQARKFSWRETAIRTARSYELALSGGREPREPPRG